MKRIATMILLLSVSATGWAHPGEHHENLLATLIHLFSEPDHLLMVFCAVALGIWGARRYAAARKVAHKQR